jgi:hypothetical protein
MSKKFWILSKENTAPFIVVALTYFLFLCTPFIYFLILKSQPHTSKSVELVKYTPPKDTINVQPVINNPDSIIDNEGYGEAQLNEFDDNDGGGTSSILTKNVKEWKRDADSRGFIILTRLAIFSIIMALGALGAAVSVISRTRNDQSVLSNISLLEVLSIQTIGAIFACVLGFAFMGNLLSGEIFPNPSVFYRIIYIPSAFAKLLVWSFIAGFSERFVPNVLNNLIKKAADTGKDKTEQITAV